MTIKLTERTGLAMCTLALAASASGCGLVLGLGDFKEGTGSGGSSSTSGTGGPTCQKGETLPCSSGLKGACSAGTKTCSSEGTGFGDCVQNLQPTATDDCVAKTDTTCDGAITCACVAGTTMVCPTELKAACATGTAICTTDGTGYNACVPDVKPTATDDCVTLTDTTCDGTIDCTCKAGVTMACTSALPGACAAGTATCKADGTGYDACVANVMPGSMTEDCKAIGDEDCDGIACSESVWSFLAGDGSIQNGPSIAMDSAGNIVAAATFDGTIKFLNKASNTNITLNSAGGFDFLLAKFDPNGDVLWAKSFGTAAQNGGPISVAIDLTGAIGISGGMQGVVNFGGASLATAGSNDIFAARFDAQGNHIWSTRVGTAGSSAIARATTFDGAGNLIIAGDTFHAFVIGASSFPDTSTGDAFVAKLAGADGSVLWAKQFKEQGGKAGDQTITCLATDTTNNIYMGGNFTGSLYLSPLAKANAVGVGVDTDGFVAKLDTSGAVSWGVLIGTTAFDGVNDIAIDSSGSILATGTIGPSFNFGGGLQTAAGNQGHAFVARYSNAGLYVSAKIFAASGGMFPGGTGTNITSDALNNVYVTGYMNENIDLGGGVLTAAAPGMNHYDIFLAKLDLGLNHVWSKSFGDANDQFSSALRFDTLSNRVVLGATIDGSVNFGNGLLTGVLPVSPDFALAKFQP